MGKTVRGTISFLAVLSFSYSQWTLDSVFYQFDLPRGDGYGIHGTKVDPAGNIWVGMYGDMAADTLFTTGGDTVNLRPIWVFEPDGSHASFSPIRYAVDAQGDTVDTLTNSCAGMSLAADGNILISQTSGELLKLNYQTGAYMAQSDDLGTGLTAPSADSDGNVYVSHVAGANQSIWKLSSDLSTSVAVCDSCGVNYNRSTLVSADGDNIYLGSTWNGIGITVLESNLLGTAYTRSDTIGNEMVADTTSTGADTTVQVNFWPEVIEWNLGVLWGGETDPAWSSHSRAGQWTGFNPSTGAIVDSLGMGLTITPTMNNDSLAALGYTTNPRGMGHSSDGTTLYVADFSTNAIQVWSNANPVTLDIDDDSESSNPIVALGYELHQAYPNPFNPTTTIEYEVGQVGNAKVEIFNLRGEHIKTLAEGWHFHGKHSVTWDGKDSNGNPVASGAYIYRLSSPYVNFSKRVTLLK